MRKPWLIGLCTAAAIALASPASALATDRFVDKDTGSDGGPNPCTSSAAPCQSITHAVSVAQINDTIKVDDSLTPYAEGTLDLVNAVSVAGTEFVGGDEGDVVLDNGAPTALRVPGAGSAGTISGLTLKSTGTALLLQATTVAVTGNKFPSGGGGQTDISIQAATSPTISQNQFTDLSTTAADTAIKVDFGSPTIIGNTFTGQNHAIEIGQTSPANNTRVEDNQITGVHSTMAVNGVGISAGQSTGMVIEDNRLTGVDTSTTGITVHRAAGTASGALRRNQVYDFGIGVLIDDTTSASMNGDVVAGSLAEGVFAGDFGANGGDLTMKNVTVVSAAAIPDVRALDTQVTIDSSIIGDGGATNGASGGTCVITRSRGPSTTPGGDGCDDFQTTAAPNFVNAVADDYHLTANNPLLIDLGDPAAPSAPDNLDFDLQKRNIDGDGNCTEVRDIGADEFLPAAPTANITSGPANGSTINTASTSFTFTNSNTCPGASFQCSLDGAAFSGCTSPANLSGLAEGAHTFAVRALDLVPQPGASVTRSFAVDLPDPPVITPTPIATTPAPAPTVTPRKKCRKKKGAAAAKKCKKK